MSKIFNVLPYCKGQEAEKTLIKLTLTNKTIIKNSLTIEHSMKNIKK